MNYRSIFSILAALILSVSHLNAEGLPLVSDDFSTEALLAEKWKLTPALSWKVQQGALVAGANAGVRSARAKLVHVGPVEVRLRIKAMAFKDGHWCGARVRGILFTLRKEGFWHVYDIEGKPRSLGGICSNEKPSPDTWYDFRIVQRKMRYQWFVNGKRIADFSEPNRIKRQKPLIELATSAPPVSFDNLQVFALAEGEKESPNLIRNSSFEVANDHLPTLWIPFYIPHIPPEILWRDWRVDGSQAYRGKHSLRIVGHKKSGNGFFCAITGIAMEQPCTFSIYLKADRPGRKARLVMWERLGRFHHKPIELTTGWKRYSFTLEAPEKNLLRAGLNLQQDAVVWADAGQLELGSAATPYQPSRFDREKPDKPAQMRIPEPKLLQFVDTPPTLDGRLDEAAWNEASRVWPLVLSGDKEPVEKTDAHMVFSQGVLYIGMRCHDSHIDRLTAKIGEHDGNVWLDDAVEVFFDTNHDRQSYFHLVVNSKGVRFDAAPVRDRSWNGKWSARTSIGKTSWSAEIALPLSSLKLTPTTSEKWGINLCRHSPRTGEFSSTAVTPVPNFHRPDLYPTLDWPLADVLKVSQLLPTDLMLLTDSKGYRLSGRLLNRTGQDVTLQIAGTLDSSRRAESTILWQSETITVKNDEARQFSIAIEAERTKAKERQISGEIRTTGNPARVIRTFQQRVPVRSVFDGLLERSVYATESEARFIADIFLPSAELAQAKVRIQFETEPRLKFEFSKLTRRSELSFAIEKRPPGSYPFSARLLSGKGGELGKVRTALTKLAPSESAVAIDRSRRCLLVDGQPWLAIAPLYQFWPHTPVATVDTRMSHCADSGFKTVMIVCRTEKAEAVWQTVFDRAGERGLKVIAWAHGFPGLVPEEFISRWKSHPALLAWMPIDEPELYAKPEDVTRAFAHFQKLDPYHPVYMNNTVMGIPSHFAGLPGDIVSIDDYLTNRPNRKVAEMVKDIEMMNEVAIPSRRPVWMFLAGNNLYNHSREPTAGEQVAQTYGCVIAGASGIKYFLGDPISPKHWAAMKRTNAELLQLAPVIYSRAPAPSAECSASSIRFITRRSGIHTYLMAVNLENEKTDASFSITGLADPDAITLFEDRLVPIRSGLLKDTFAPHERHVYRIRGD